MAAMKLETSHYPDLKMLIAMIARSPIVVKVCALAHLPAGYEKVDVAVLRWIAADSRRSSHSRRSN